MKPQINTKRPALPLIQSDTYSLATVDEELEKAVLGSALTDPRLITDLFRYI